MLKTMKTQDVLAIQPRALTPSREGVFLSIAFPESDPILNSICIINYHTSFVAFQV